MSAPPGQGRRGLDRRAFLGRAGAVGLGGVAAAGVVDVVRPIAAGAAVGDHYNGFIVDRGGQVFNVKNSTYGAKGDTRRVSGGSIAAGSTTLTSPAGGFASGDVGKVVTVQGAGVSGGVLTATIASVSSPTQVTLGAPASTGVTAAELAYGTDDTTALLAAITAAGATGELFVPPGVYLIRGASNGGAPITLAGGGGLRGNGGKHLARVTAPNTAFLCADDTAGIAAQGAALYQGFLVDGNGVASAPLQIGSVSGGVAVAPGRAAVFIDVWTVRSAVHGWTIYGARDHSYYDCGTSGNAVDGVFIDGGAQGIEFFHFLESDSPRHGVHGGESVPLDGVHGTSGVRFYGGSLRSVPGGTAGVSKVHLRGATDWGFSGVKLEGTNLTGPVVDLDQSTGGNLDVSGCWMQGTVTGNTPGLACIRITGAPGSGDASSFLKTNGVNFVGGDSSLYVAVPGSYRYSAIGWVGDGTTNGPGAGTGPAIDTLLIGRTGPWQVVAVNNANWTGAVAYRINADGRVQLQGSVALVPGGAGGTIFTLPEGYRPTSVPSRGAAAAQSDGTVGRVTVSSAGVVAGNSPGSGNSLFFDGIAFPVP